jgi:hypothetical protein
MNKEMTTCEYDGDPRQLTCQREEQCDDCFMIDHLKECEWCEHYDHPSRKLEVKHLPSDYPTDDEGDRTAVDYADANPTPEYGN